MKQKVVIKVSMNGPKSRSKALTIAVGISGVETAGLGGQDKSQIEVTGDGVDAVQLTTLLRKSVGYAELISVTPVGEKKEEKKDDKKEEIKIQPMVLPYGGSVPYFVSDFNYPVYPVQYHEPNRCPIM